MTDPSPFATPSFAKALFCGELHEEMVFPYPRLDPAERGQVDALIASLDDFTSAHYDPAAAERDGWVGDDVIRGLGERGLMGLYVPTEYGGQGLSQTGYCRVFEAIAAVDPTLAVVMGVHQSIGMKGIHLFGTDDQKARFLPDLAAARKLAGFALTEPTAGSDAYHLETRAERQSDGSWRLNGEKRWIGNGSKDVLVTFARSDEGHVALIVESGMAGFEVGRRYETMGLKANDLRHLYFRDVRVPPENLLGAPGDGFKIAMEVLNNGRMSLGTGAVGGAKKLLDLAIEHVHERRQFGRPLADFELVREKIGWIVSYLYGLQSMGYLSTGLVDRGVADYSLESAMVKVSGTEFIWYAANRVFQLAGGEAYMADRPYEKILRDIRIFPIFEGANDVLRMFIALTGLQPLGEELKGLGELDLREPVRSLGVLADYARDRVRLKVRPDKLTLAHPELAKLADPVSDQVARLRATSEKLLRKHGKRIVERQGQLKRLSQAVSDLYAQIAVISRVSDVLERGGDPAQYDEERYIAETFATRAGRRVDRWLDQVEHNDDDRIHAISAAAYRRGEYGHSI